MSKNNLLTVRRMHGRMHELKLRIKRELKQRNTLKNSGPNAVFLVGTPIHPNIGDSAIVVAEISFLRKILPKNIKLVEITEPFFCKHRMLAKRSMLRSEGLPVFWHGGGNMGDVWIEEEIVRRKALLILKHKRIISFPQTIYYSDTETGNRQTAASIPIYNGRKGLTLTAREVKSYDIMKALYPKTDLYLMPDIVLSSSAAEYGVFPQTRHGVLMCLRNDIEKTFGDDFWDDLRRQVESMVPKCRVTDMEADSVIFLEQREEIVRKKMQEFRGAKLAITDRLHGMVFAALTGTPCIVFSNNNHKVKSTYEWLRYLPYIRYVETIEEAVRCIPGLLAMENCEFDNSPLIPYFNKLKEIILEACNRDTSAKQEYA